MRYYLLIVTLGIFFNLFAQPNIESVEYVSGISSPVDITNAGDERLFIVQQGGQIRIVDGAGDLMPTPFLDIDPLTDGGGEQGLLGLAFHPDYANNGYFFVNYTKNNGDTQISRFSVSADDPNMADPDSELHILTIDQPYSNHNGGCVKFGPDGYLYIGMGDGGAGGDPEGNGQNRMALLAKMLRIDIDNGVPYAIPASNPFVDDTLTLDEIWAIGVRNPWRFSFDRETGDLWMGDVGQNAWEEINFQPAASTGGENYGWRCYEGNHTYNTSNCENASTYDFPVHEYANSFTGGCSVTGGYVYRGTEIEGLQGYYLYSDYCGGTITYVHPDGAEGWESQELFDTGSFISSFGEDAAGELYYADLFAGKVFKIIGMGDACASFTASETHQNESCEGQADGFILIDAPEGSSIQWITGSTENPLTGLSAGNYSARVTKGDCEVIIAVTLTSENPAIAVPEISIENIQSNVFLVPDIYATYQWYINEMLIPNATSNAFTVIDEGSYFVVVTNEAGCVASSDTLGITPVNSLEVLNIRSLNVSPVPFKDGFNLALEPLSSGQYTFAIHSAIGKEITRFEENITGLFHKNVELNDLPAGIYFLVIEHDGLKYARRLVKQ